MANALAAWAAQPLRTVQDYQDADAERQQRGMRNALLQMQMQQAQQGMAQQQAVRNALSQHGATEQGANALMQLGAFDQAQAIQKQVAARQQAEAAARQEQARQQALRGLMPTQAIDANRASGVTGPMPEALGVVGQRQRFDPATMLAAGFAPAEVEKMQGLIDPRTEVKDYQQVRMPDGSVKVVGLTKDGKVVETGQSPFIKPEFQRMGSHVAAIDPVSLASKNVGAINMSAAEAAQDARARQSLGLQAARLNFDRERAAAGQGGAGPNAPAGKPLTEAQAKGAAFAMQMQAAEKEILDVGRDQSKLLNQADVAMASGPLNILASKEGQRIRQAQDQWSEAFLRFKTGAAATEGEVERNRKTFFPVQNDTPAIVEQKRRMRQHAMESVMFTVNGRQGQELPQPAAAPKVVDFGSLK